jgi:hypothetical protein
MMVKTRLIFQLPLALSSLAVAQPPPGAGAPVRLLLRTDHSRSGHANLTAIPCLPGT